MSNYKKILEEITGVSLSEILKNNHSNPEQYWPVHNNYLSSFDQKKILGQNIAKNKKVNILCLARDCGQQLLNSIVLVDKVRDFFSESNVFIYENDSIDNTKNILKEHCGYYNYNVISLDDGQPYLIGTETQRTYNLAKYRNYCLNWAKEHSPDYDYTIVLDLDADGGFSVDGIFNSIYWLDNLPQAGGICSYSLFVRLRNGKVSIRHYDHFAARLNSWDITKTHKTIHSWFSYLYLPVGSDPFIMNSCFGGLGVYKTQAYFSGLYSGEDCEHVTFHKRLYENNWRIYLNPGSRFASVIDIDNYDYQGDIEAI